MWGGCVDYKQTIPKWCMDLNALNTLMATGSPVSLSLPRLTTANPARMQHRMVGSATAKYCVLPCL
jgi:hypothetical protein